MVNSSKIAIVAVMFALIASKNIKIIAAKEFAECMNAVIGNL